MIRRKVTFLAAASQKEVLSELVPIAERSWELVDALIDAGWDVVVPRIKFEESFGQGDEVGDYRRAVIELAKVTLGSPNIRFQFPECGPYISQFLQNLRHRWNNENNETFGSNNVPVWAKEAVPCLRRMERFRYAQRTEFDHRLHDVVKEEEQRRTKEIASHASGRSLHFLQDLQRPVNFYKAIVEREAEGMGFTCDESRSDVNYTTFSKPLLDGWDLCLSPSPLIWYPGREDGEVRLLLSLQASHHHRFPIKRSRWNQVLIIEYSELIRHFDRRYLAFKSLEELEVIIMARVFLLSLIVEEIEARLRTGLARVIAGRG